MISVDILFAPGNQIITPQKKLHQSPKKDAEFHNVDLITKDA